MRRRTPIYDPLGQVAAAHGLTYGSIVSGINTGWLDFFDYGVLSEREMGAHSIEWQTNWKWTEPTQGVFDLSDADVGVAWAKARSLPIAAYTGIWHEEVPTWLTTALTAVPANWDDIIDAHLAGTMLHTDTGIDYTTDIGTWNVVNEGFWQFDTNGIFRESFWYNAVVAAGGAGHEYISHAFTQARTHAPTARLVLNETLLERPLLGQVRGGVYQWLDTWLTAGIPIDALGIQSHLDLDEPFVEADWRHFLRGVYALGIGIDITELDCIGTEVGSIWKQRQEVADYVRRYLDVCLEEGVRRINTWGLAGGDLWWKGGLTPVSGVPYSAAPFRPEPLRDAVIQSMRRAHAPEPALTEDWTGDDGQRWDIGRWPIIEQPLSGVGAPVVDIQANAGRMLIQGAAYTYARAYFAYQPLADFELTIDFTLDAGAAEAYHDIGFRHGAGGSYLLSIWTAQAHFVLQSFVQGVGTSLVVPEVTKVWNTDVWHIRLNVVGTAIKARAWQGIEPGTWDIDTTDSDHSTGQLFLNAVNGSAARTITFDALSITDLSV